MIKTRPIKLKSLMEDLNLYGDQDKTEVKLTPDQKKTIMDMIADYNKYSKYLQRDKSLTDIAKRLSQICNHAETLLSSEEGDWFDKQTVSRHAKELKKYIDDFTKVATEAHLLEQRMLALFEDCGNILNKYFKIEDEMPKAEIPQAIGSSNKTGTATPDNAPKSPIR